MQQRDQSQTSGANTTMSGGSSAGSTPEDDGDLVASGSDLGDVDDDDLDGDLDDGVSTGAGSSGMRGPGSGSRP